MPSQHGVRDRSSVPRTPRLKEPRPVFQPGAIVVQLRRSRAFRFPAGPALRLREPTARDASGSPGAELPSRANDETWGRQPMLREPLDEFGLGPEASISA